MKSWRNLPLSVRVAVGFLAFGLVWIVSSDWIVEHLAASEAQHAWFQTYKGLAFVTVSAGFVGWLVFRESRQRALVRRLLGELVDLSPAPIVVRRADDATIVEANQKFADEANLERESVVGSSIDELDIDFAERHRDELRRCLDEEGEVLDYQQCFGEGTGRAADLLVSSRKIEFGEEEYVCTMARDITELKRAYDETIRGWARALELRDDETFAHTLRVTRATVALARSTGVEKEEIVHIRRGALLHDIGKIGVPDSILLKDGDLTDDEWSVVQKHSIFAKELLSPIEYLEPAVDIPYRHHEKWDGSGYPDGLEGDEIPLPARIFAVVDVWDALRSDRPYRDAWEPEPVLDHLEEQKETHFQPEIVDAFFELGDERRREIREVDSVSILQRTAESAAE